MAPMQEEEEDESKYILDNDMFNKTSFILLV